MHVGYLCYLPRYSAKIHSAETILSPARTLATVVSCAENMINFSSMELFMTFIMFSLVSFRNPLTVELIWRSVKNRLM